HQVVRPTSRSRAPSAITLWVSLGTSDTMRRGGCANVSVRPRSSASFTIAIERVYLTCYARGVPSTEDPLVTQAFDAKKHEDLARAIAGLSSEEAAFFLHKLELAIRKRKIQITGYLVAMVVWLAG